MSNEQRYRSIDDVIERALFTSGFDSKRYIGNISEEEKQKLEVKMKSMENLMNEMLHEIFELCFTASHNDYPLTSIVGEDKRIISAYAAGALFATRIHFDKDYQSFSPKLQDILKRYIDVNEKFYKYICETATKQK